MTLTSDTCGGANPLLSLANNYRASLRVDNDFVGNHEGTHLMSDLLHFHAVSTSKEKDQTQDFRPLQETSTVAKNQLCNKNLNKSFSDFTSSYQKQVVPTPLHQTHQPWRPHQKYIVKSLQNQLFEEWVRRYHPEVALSVRASEIVDVELPHELAEEWLKDFHLNDVIKLESQEEAESIVREWIREFRLGSRLSAEENKDVKESNEKGYDFVNVSSGSAEKSIDAGIDMIKQGDLVSAISILEDLAKENEQFGEAWYYLGLCHQQSENEDRAISAFNRVRSEDVCYESTLLGLAASYANEHKHNSAVTCLTEWLQINHPHLTPRKGDTDSSNATLLRSCISSINPTPQKDIEIHTAMGILSCLLDEPHVAVEHFSAAVSTSPRDFMLWNRLGATLANSDRSFESVDAYKRALSLSPGYIRARYNLGIACLNLGAYREGIEHFLVCLQQQDSETVWETLRLALSLDKQYSYIDHVDSKSLGQLLSKFDIA